MRKTALYMAVLTSALLLAACRSTAASSPAGSASYTDDKENTVENSDSISESSDAGADVSSEAAADVASSVGETIAASEEETAAAEEETEEVSTAEETEAAPAEEKTEEANGGSQKAYLSGTYPYGSKAEDASGVTYFLLYNDHDMTRAMLTYLFPDQSTVTFVEGEVTTDDEGYTIHDIQEDIAVTFRVVGTDDHGFDIQFYQTDEVISFVNDDVRDVIDDVCGCLETGNVVSLKDVSAE